MKTVLPALALLLFTSVSAQKFDRDILDFQNTHLPGKLIYDQVKNYGVNVTANNTLQFTLDNNVANSLAVSLTSYDKVDFASAHLKVYVTYGPYTFAEEKTLSETKDEKADSVTKKVTYYKRVLNFKYPISYKLVNSKNNLTLYNNEFASSNIRTVETAQFKTEAEAIKSLNDSRTAYLTANINELCGSFINPCNNSIRDQFDFYPVHNGLDFYKIKKWDKDDEYNAHVKTVLNAFRAQTAADLPARVMEKIKEDVLYFQSYEGKFNPTDKKEDILYFCNYYNLATIFFCLDDFEKANYYINKLDSSKKQEGNTAYFKKLITSGINRTAKHFLTTTHLSYNPVKDYRLAGKDFKSDAGDAPITAVAGTQIVPVKIYDQTGDKRKVLKYIWLAYQCWTTGSNTDYSEPADYIYKANTTDITGQKFLYPVHNKKYITIALNIVDKAIPGATLEIYPNKSKVLLTWTADKLTGIKIDGLNEFDYILTYEKDSVLTGFISRNMINGNITTVMKFEYNNNKIAKVTKYENKTSFSPWIRSIKTFTYTDTETIVDCLTYFTNKPNTPKNSSTLQGIYKKSTKNPYIIVQPYGETTEISYNANDEIETKVVRKRNSAEEHSFIYEGGKLFKEVTLTTNLNGEFVEKAIFIAFNLPAASPSLPDYEKTEGNYKFNQYDELIYEARDLKYRNKVNGVWSEWKYFRY
jgi:hypothetical protein